MSIFDRFKNKAGSSNSRAANPDGSPPADKLDGSKNPSINGDGVAETEGLPAVNRRRNNNQMVNILGVVFILAVGGAFIVAVNKPKGPAKVKALTESDRVSNTLPAFTMPSPPPPPALAAPTAAPVATAPVQTIPLQGGAQPPKLGANGKPILEWYDRKRSGDLMVSSAGASQTASGTSAVGLQTASKDAVANSALDGGGNTRSDLATRLEPTAAKPASARMLPDRNYLITKGTTLDCALETALDSTVPGITTCRLTRDIYSDNGQVVLLDRGSQLTGEYQGGIKQGQARIFTLWTRAKTPNGVVVALNSPGTDALGRSGVEGWVDTHFAARFGAAIMFSLLKDGLAVIAANQQRAGGGQVVYGNTQQAGEQAVGKVLDSTINIPPTLIKNQGDHIQVMVARDLDFGGVYALRAKE